jgi:hypothetical protein
VSDDLKDVVERLERLPQVVTFETRRAMSASLLLIEADARRSAPQDTRRLSGSITWNIQGQGLALTGVVGPSVRYGAPVEFGRRAGARMPPVNALIGWVQRHFHAPRERVAAATLQREAFGLARAISRRGIVERPYMRPAYENNRTRIEALFGEVGRRAVVSIIGGTQA